MLVENDLVDKLERMERQLREHERRLAKLPSDEWRAVEVGSELRIIYVPTGQTGPMIGQQ